MASIRILLCDDHELVRRGLRSLLDVVADFDVVGEAGDANEAVKAVEEFAPDVVVMDVRLPGRSGIEACRDIRSAHPDAHVLMLTSFADDEALFSSIMAGASGYAVTARVLARLRGEATVPSDGVAELTPQERKILDLVAEGLTNRQIAERIHLAEKTVKNYVSNILMKLGLARRAEVAAYMAKRRVQPPDQWP
jgi:DNA-binding NarL/FixJ family response regulator